MRVVAVAGVYGIDACVVLRACARGAGVAGQCGCAGVAARQATRCTQSLSRLGAEQVVCAALPARSSRARSAQC